MNTKMETNDTQQIDFTCTCGRKHRLTVFTEVRPGGAIKDSPTLIRRLQSSLPGDDFVWIGSIRLARFEAAKLGKRIMAFLEGQPDDENERWRILILNPKFIEGGAK